MPKKQCDIGEQTVRELDGLPSGSLFRLPMFWSTENQVKLPIEITQCITEQSSDEDLIKRCESNEWKLYSERAEALVELFRRVNESEVAAEYISTWLEGILNGPHRVQHCGMPHSTLLFYINSHLHDEISCLSGRNKFALIHERLLIAVKLALLTHVPGRLKQLSDHAGLKDFEKEVRRHPISRSALMLMLLDTNDEHPSYSMGNNTNFGTYAFAMLMKTMPNETQRNIAGKLHSFSYNEHDKPQYTYLLDRARNASWNFLLHITDEIINTLSELTETYTNEVALNSWDAHAYLLKALPNIIASLSFNKETNETAKSINALLVKLLINALTNSCDEDVQILLISVFKYIPTKLTSKQSEVIFEWILNKLDDEPYICAYNEISSVYRHFNNAQLLILVTKLIEINNRDDFDTDSSAKSLNLLSRSVNLPALFDKPDFDCHFTDKMSKNNRAMVIDKEPVKLLKDILVSAGITTNKLFDQHINTVIEQGQYENATSLVLAFVEQSYHIYESCHEQLYGILDGYSNKIVNHQEMPIIIGLLVGYYKYVNGEEKNDCLDVAQKLLAHAFYSTDIIGYHQLTREGTSVDAYKNAYDYLLPMLNDMQAEEFLNSIIDYERAITCPNQLVLLNRVLEIFDDRHFSAKQLQKILSHSFSLSCGDDSNLSFPSANLVTEAISRSIARLNPEQIAIFIDEMLDVLALKRFNLDTMSRKIVMVNHLLMVIERLPSTCKQEYGERILLTFNELLLQLDRDSGCFKNHRNHLLSTIAHIAYWVDPVCLQSTIDVIRRTEFVCDEDLNIIDTICRDEEAQSAPVLTCKP